MADHVTGISAPQSAIPISLSELRQHVLALLLGNALFTAAEQVRATQFVHECQNVARLTRWHANVLTEIAHRVTTAARQIGKAALCTTLRRLRPVGFRAHRPRRPRPVPSWKPGTPLPCRPDYQAGTFDCRATARF